MSADARMLAGMAALPSQPLSDISSVGVGASRPSQSVLANVLSGSDAEAELVKGVLDHQLILTANATAAAAFLFAYGLEDLMWLILKLRTYHQRPSGLVKALDAVSLKAMMGRLDINLGNK